MKTTNSSKICYLLFYWAAIFSGVVKADDFAIPYKYMNYNDQVVSGAYLFVNLGYSASSSPYCTENHRDPDGAKYTHGHAYEAFPFWIGEDYVTAARSDMAWDFLRTPQNGYTRLSSSTFLQNCYSYVTDAPTPMASDAWEAFTTTSSQCEWTNKKKSFALPLPNDHSVWISSTQQIGETADCVTLQTKDKPASGGVYSKGWGTEGINITYPVRKRK